MIAACRQHLLKLNAGQAELLCNEHLVEVQKCQGKVRVNGWMDESGLCALIPTNSRLWFLLTVTMIAPSLKYWQQFPTSTDCEMPE